MAAAAAAAGTATTVAGPGRGYASPSPADGAARCASVHRHGASSVCGGKRTLALEVATRRRRPQAANSSRRHVAITRAAAEGGATSDRIIHGKCFVVGDNIDTDQIIPAEHLTLVPSKPEEYKKLGSYAMSGLPSAAGYGTFIEPGSSKSEYRVMIGGANFGCGSSREHAPVALGAAGVRAVVARSYARIFFRNSVATGELYPVESHDRICEHFKTGEIVTVDLERDVLVNHTTGSTYSLQSIGEAGPVIDAGGLFEYARKMGMIATAAA